MGRYEEIRNKEYKYYDEGEAAFGKEELDELRKQSPEFWWRPLGRIRCPDCGQNGQAVGSTFRAPRKADAKGWRQVQKMIDGGEKFSYCVTPKEEQELVKEGARLRHREMIDTEWRSEKQRRIGALKAATDGRRRTDDHENFVVVRQLKGVEEP